MQGGRCPPCISHREIPAFAGMGEWGEWGGSFNFGGNGEERRSAEIKKHPHSREGGNLPTSGAGNARTELDAGRALPALHQPQGDSRLRGNGGVGGMGEVGSESADDKIKRTPHSRAGGNLPVVRRRRMFAPQALELGDSRLRGNGGGFFVIFLLPPLLPHFPPLFHSPLLQGARAKIKRTPHS